LRANLKHRPRPTVVWRSIVICAVKGVQQCWSSVLCVALQRTITRGALWCFEQIQTFKFDLYL